ncbi:MAG: winged helix-turn-helix transcriptional regulator [Planctomycetes bacterium]|nr:winged helix-turn-helix transcriptional regulator [Planctomycetota bacterium]
MKDRPPTTGSCPRSVAARVAASAAGVPGHGNTSSARHGQETGRPAFDGVAGVKATTAPRAPRASSDDASDRLLAYVKAHPGQRGEEIAAALGTDTYSMRPAMKRLIDAGEVRTEGENRGMRYFVAR